MPTGTDAVLTEEVQGLIDSTIRRTGTDSGVGFGYLDPEDVRSHLEEAAVAAMHRYDSSRGDVIGFLRRRLRGAAIDLIRTQGARTRLRNPSRDRPARPPGGDWRRPVMVSLETERESDEGGGLHAVRPLYARMTARSFNGGTGARTLLFAEAVEDPGATEEMRGVDELADLTLALSSLPTRLRLVLYLLFYEELPPAQVAARLQVTEETVRALRDAGLTKMRLALVRGANGRG